VCNVDNHYEVQELSDKSSRGSNYKSGRNLLWWKEVHDYIPVNWKLGQVLTPEKRRCRALGPCMWMPIITQATTLMPRHLETRKLGVGGAKGPATPPSSLLLLYRIVVGCRFSGFLIPNSHQSKLHTNSNDIWQFINKGKCATPLVASTWLQLWNSSRFFFFFCFFLLTSFIHSFIHVMGFCFGLLFSTKVDLIQKRISIPMYVSVKAFFRQRCLVSSFFLEDFFED
jgi:hypothetical protein